MKAISSSNNTLILDPTSPPNDVIKNSDMVISFPFSSLNELAGKYNKPACFYDATSKLLPDTKAARGIPKFHNEDELRKWIIRNSK